MSEKAFQTKIIKALKERGAFVFKHEGHFVGGIPDLIGCYNGWFVAMEVKKSESEARKNTGPIARQKHTLRQINGCHGLGYIVYPENFDEVMNDLDQRCVLRFSTALPL